MWTQRAKDLLSKVEEEERNQGMEKETEALARMKAKKARPFQLLNGDAYIGKEGTVWNRPLTYDDLGTGYVSPKEDLYPEEQGETRLSEHSESRVEYQRDPDPPN
mgnify:CR=1 FL=1